MKKLIIITVLGLLFSPGLRADKKAEDFKEKIRKYYENLTLMAQPKEGEVYHFAYTEHMTTWGNTVVKVPLDNQVDIYVKPGKFHFYSNNVDVLRDEEDVFVVMHNEKTIFRTNPILGVDHQKRLEDFVELQNQVFQEGQVLEFQELFVKGKRMARLIISTPEEIQRQLKIKYCTYWYDIDADELWKSKIHFTQDYSVKTKEIVYTTMDFDYGKKLNKPVFKQVVDKKGNLRSPFEQYRIIENKDDE